MPTTRSGRFRARRELSDRNRRRVRREKQRVGEGLVHEREKVTLDPTILEHRLDHRIGATQIFQTRSVDHAVRERGGVLLAELAARDSLADGRGYPLARALQRRLLRLVDDHLLARPRSGLRDPRTHEPGADDTDHRHAHR